MPQTSGADAPLWKNTFSHGGAGITEKPAGDCVGTAAFDARMGQNQSKNSASGLARFLLFFCQSQLAGIIRAHPSHPWLVLFQQRPARGLLKTSSFAWIRGPVSFTAETAVPPSFSPRLSGSAG